MTTTKSVNAPAAKPRMLFADPTNEAVDRVTNSSYDDLRDGKHEDPPLSEAEERYLPGEGGYDVPGVCGDLIFGASGVLNGTRVFIVTLEFHYRNDASREMWGSPIRLETNIKATMEEQTLAIKRAFCRCWNVISQMGGDVAMSFREIMQADDRSTDDRHILYLYLPIETVMEQRPNLLEWLVQLFGRYKGFETNPYQEKEELIEDYFANATMPEIVKDSGGWEWGPDYCSRIVFFEGEDDGPSRKGTFTVEFERGTCQTKSVVLTDPNGKFYDHKCAKPSRPRPAAEGG